VPGIRPAGVRGGGVIDFYQVLGVDPDASVEEVRRAYRRLAREHHPDVNPDPEAPHRFRRITEAYQVLSDEQARATYRPPDDGVADPPEPPVRQPEPHVRQPEPGPLAHQPAVNGLAGMSLPVSVAAVCLPGPFLCFGYPGLVGALMGHVARRRIRRSGEAGAGLATVGIVVGWAVTVVTVAATAAGIIVSQAS
jgi:hypothetical protein